MQRKKIVKIAVGIVLAPLLLFVVLAVLIYLPPIQNMVVRQVADYASRQTGMDISVDRVKLVFPLDLGVEGFCMSRTNDSIPTRKDTIASVGSLVVDVRLWPLLSKKVEIDAFRLADVRLNTADMISSARVSGGIGRLSLQSHGIDLGKETVRINKAVLADAALDVELADTVPPDTSTTTTNWAITLDELDVERTGVTIHTSGDTLQIAAYLGMAEAKRGHFDLAKSEYSLHSLDIEEGRMAYGKAPSYIELSSVTIGVDSIYFCQPDLSLRLRACSFKEKSGLTVENITAAVDMDSVRISVPSVLLTTPNSQVSMRLAMDNDAFDKRNPGRIDFSADCAIGKQDIMRLIGDMPTGFVRRWPNQQLTIKAAVAGNMDNLNFGGVNVKLPSAFNLNLKGTAGNLTDTDNMRASAKLDVTTYDLDFVNELLTANGVDAVIPRNIGIRGDIGIKGKRYEADLIATEDSGRIEAKGWFDAVRNGYSASLVAENVAVSHFLPSGGMGGLTAHAEATGTGIDFTSARTTLNATAVIDSFSMGGYRLDGISLQADMGEGSAHAVLDSRNPLATGLVTVDAQMGKEMTVATLDADIRNADWYSLRLVESRLSTSLRCRVDVGTDMKNMLSVKGMLRDLAIKDSANVYKPDDLMVDVLTSRDTTHFVAECGDFKLHFNGQYGYKKLMAKAEEFANELSTQLDNKQIDVSALRKCLPVAHLYLTTGKENPLSRFIARNGFTFQDADIDIATSPLLGFNGDIRLLGLQNSAVTLDTIRFNIVSDTANCTYSGQIRNNEKNKQYVFNALLDGHIFDKGSGANLRIFDAADSLGVKLGFTASMEDDGIKVHMQTDDPIIGYKRFNVNKDNYLLLGTDRRVSAKLYLMADDGTGAHIYTNDENTEALQDITVGLNKFDLSEIMSVLPYMPNITGTMNGDFHLIQTPDEMSVSSSLAVDDMTYERSRMGDLSTEFVYMPLEDGKHAIDGVLSCNGNQVAELSGTYASDGNGGLDAELNMTRMPVRLINGFIPDRIIRMTGYADGQLAISGTADRPLADGEIRFDSCYVRSAQYGVRMRCGEEPLRIVGSNLLFEDFKLHANNDTPLTLNGNIDFSNLDKMAMDLRMMARNYLIIDSKENRRSVAFGKAYVDFFATMKGPMESLQMLGRLDVLGTTDMAYILRDSPLTTDNRMDDLVKFVSFEDTTATVVEHQPMSGFSMDLTLNISNGARVLCYLNTDHSNFIDLMGGGSLRLQYGLDGEMSLTGRYTLDNGEMKYSLPIIPLKTFIIQDGSYIEFTGDPMNPKLNITATERTKATVSSGGNGMGRTVEFDCGVVITKTLSDMGLEFTLSAPEDMTINNELQSMSADQRGKMAVTMLTTGMYLADGNTGGFSMNNALSSFLQSEINNISGSALRTLDVSFGMDNSTDESGSTYTDYSFKFSKRFWNNRIRIVVGGKVSTGSEVTNQNESFFDNVTLEYRLGDSSDKYVKLYYDNNAYDWLEGTVREYGAGFIWRRNLQNFKDIFNFGRKREEKVKSEEQRVKNEVRRTKNEEPKSEE